MPVVRGDVLTVSLVMHFLALALPLALLQIYDRILPAQAYGTAVFLVIGVGIAIILEAILRYGRTAMFARLGARYEADATMRAFDRLLRADLAEVEKRGTAAVVDDLRAISQVRDFWSGQAGAALYEAPFVVVYLALIAYVGGWLVVIPLFLFAAAIVVAMVWNPGIEQAALAVEQEGRQRRDFLWTAFAALDDIKSAGAEGPVGAYYRHSNDRYLARSAELETRLGWIRENASAFGQLATVLIVAFGAVSVVAGDLTTGALAACTMLAGRSIGPAMASLGYWSQLARIGEARDRVDELLDMPLNLGFGRDGAAAADAPRVTRGEISLEAPGILDGKVTIQPGEVVHLATVDTPIASKLLSAVSGMTYDPAIAVRVDGRAVADYGRREYREAVVLVTRQLALVPGSILENLTLFDPRYNADARDYCEKLGLQAHLDRLRHGILTQVGPGTAEHLDEGLYQRIALIRALLRKPKILLLDHASSGIDLDGVKRLADLLKAMQGGTTVLISTYKEALIEATTRQVLVGGKGA
jgi:ABC-type bacteriocin/lantibiotic exporter with double-glycine peptidase domain